MKRIITCSPEQAAVITRACELLARVDIGHFEYIAEELIGHEISTVDYRTKYVALCRLKHELFDLSPTSNLGLHNPKVPERARVAWDIASALRKTLVEPAAATETPIEVRDVRFPAGRHSSLESDFARHAGRTMFVLQWADYEEKADRGYSGGDFFNLAPETPDEFIAEGWKYLGALEHVNRMSLLLLLRRAAIADGEKESAYWDTAHAEDFAYGCTMSAAGHGVSWFDSHKRWDDFKNVHLDAIPELDPNDYPELEEEESDDDK